MAGLSVKGDPEGWLDAGRAVSTLMAQLDSELADANRVSGAGLTNLWQGPAASAFATDWSARRSRYEDLIDHAQRVAQAITGYAEKLLGLVQAAANLESTWCSVGLHLLESGAGFMLPPGVESMPTGTQLSLRQALTQSEHDVEQLAADAAGAAEDLAVALGAAIAALLAFDLIEVGVLRSIADGFVSERLSPSELPHDVLDIVEVGSRALRVYFDTEAANAGTRAAQLSSDLRDGTPDEQSVAGSLLPQAGRDAQTAAANADDINQLDDVASPLAVVTNNGLTLGKVIYDGQHEGYRASLEQNAGLIASTATDDAIVLAFPQAGPVGVAAGAIVAAGVGYTVQTIVDHRQAIGHFVEDVF
jgi:hypothetical protein